MPKFKRGEVHNAAGRPRGTGHRQQLFNQLVLPHKEDLVEKAISLALSGSEIMLRLFLERLLPPKPRDEEPINQMTHEDALKELEYNFPIS